ncbi:uncharacterized protein LOC135503467 [Lineus longissimus]|uniref:uncharacterized protein LOC135503467 n=1 Tax=Lineus longissimus TaxID=88925 RepID=UPI00315C7B4C
MLEDTIEKIRKEKFSMNMDESTSENLKKVMEVLVSFYDNTAESVVVEHLASLDISHSGAAPLFGDVCDLFQRHELPWNNLVSVLLDSCNVMRGSKSGLETRLRQGRAPHLLDIDGDSCHHVNNCAKVFCKPFEGYVEKLHSDIHTDFKWSQDLVDILKEICLVLGIKFTMPERFVNHRWLSCYDVSLGNIRLFDCYRLMYYGFLSKADMVTYSNVLDEIFTKYEVSDTARKQIRKLHGVLGAKNMTKEGTDRKKRIVEKVIFKERLTLLILNFYISALAMLKEYVCLFQLKEPMLHKIHDQQEALVRKFLSCFCKPETVSSLSLKDILKLDFSRTDLYLPRKEMYIGHAQSIVDKFQRIRKNDKDVVSFFQAVETAYSTCATYMVKKLPINSVTLKTLSAVDPLARGHSNTLRFMKKLPALFPTVDIDENIFTLELHQYQVDLSLPNAVDPAGTAVRLDKWWSQVFKSENYPELTKVMKAVLSIFHGPAVESAFNVMGDIIDERKCRTNIATYESIQTVKYKLRSSGKSAIQYFHRPDKLHSPVNGRICKGVRHAYGRYKAELDGQAKMRKAMQKKLDVQKKKVLSKTKAKILMTTAEKECFRGHEAKLKRLERLQKLSQKMTNAKKK